MDNTQVAEWVRFLLPMASIFLVFWLLVIRPQRKEQKAKQAMLASLQKGEEVLTVGGIFGKVKFVKHKEAGSKEEETVLLEISEGASMRVLLSAIERVIKPIQNKEKGDK
jgi:preprotein translocase subunit YajC